MNILFVIFFVSLLISVALFLVFYFLSCRFIKDREKSSPFECGFDPKNSSRIPFSMRFFLLAVIFLVFDLEIILLIPFILFLSSMKSLGSLFSGFFFVLVVLLGSVYEWWEGSLSWIY